MRQIRSSLLQLRPAYLLLLPQTRSRFPDRLLPRHAISLKSFKGQQTDMIYLAQELQQTTSIFLEPFVLLWLYIVNIRQPK